MMAVRWRRYLILLAFAGIWVILALVWEPFIMPVLLLALARFRLWLYRIFISQAKCPTCGTTIPLVGSWKCGGCGFVQHRHAFKRCAKCGLGVGELPCPQCEHGMFL